jgi:hypothetical protein
VFVMSDTIAVAVSKLCLLFHWLSYSTSEIFGKVQGVYFRDNTVKKATELGLTGDHVCTNISDYFIACGGE